MRRAIWVGLLITSAVTAEAGQYPGWGDTGWVYVNKRDCCNSAIAIAQDYSIQACAEAGGVPRPTSGSRRGTCKAEWTQGADGTMVYRCYGEAAVWCR